MAKEPSLSKMRERYNKSPIMEAIIDFRVVLPDGTHSDVFLPLKASLLETYPQQEDYFEDTAEFSFGPRGGTANFKRGNEGFRFISSDKRRVLIVSEQNFRFSNLHPYDTWQTFRDEASQLWDKYKAVCHPELVRRVAVRYINRVDFPDSSRLNSFLSLYPLLPLELQQKDVQGFFVQLQIPQNDIDSMLIINQAKVEAPEPETTSIILDFDLFQEREWTVNQEAEVWEVLETLRTRKNEVFEACITQKMKDLIR